ncbi:hypothetical protein F945_03502 [Acinetobacter rudis CIP 110305]|uniref:Uncharacterized protein n=1 Tax=Acinetobacter rudis CIP 110305 TaxID=421052 RepID=S3N6P7_9GAMM|nr:hypothetical protein F945_03502 [Acinetobacter rudis CIP 110305]
MFSDMEFLSFAKIILRINLNSDIYWKMRLGSRRHGT